MNDIVLYKFVKFPKKERLKLDRNEEDTQPGGSSLGKSRSKYRSKIWSEIKGQMCKERMDSDRWHNVCSERKNRKNYRHAWFEL